MRQEHGFTLIELMIVIAIIAIIALIAIPNLLSSRLVANETSTIGTLRSLSSAEAEFQARQICDQDADGLGEYGFLQELAGSVIPRGAASLLDPPSISQALGNVDASGFATKSGYVLLFFLPGANGAIQEPPLGAPAVANPADANVQESRWACYAFPQTIRNTGNRAFVINQQAEVYATTNSGVPSQEYDLSTANKLQGNPNSAYEAGSTNLAGKFAVGIGMGQDGGTWVPAS
jgi:prepilin-type N-terminal cleavage/methylation domain-containing protein